MRRAGPAAAATRQDRAEALGVLEAPVRMGTHADRGPQEQSSRSGGTLHEAWGRSPPVFLLGSAGRRPSLQPQPRAGFTVGGALLLL